MASVTKVSSESVRKSTRLSTKVAVFYKEKKIPIRKSSQVLKKVTTKKEVVSAAINNEGVRVKKVKTEKIKSATNTIVESVDILREMHLQNAIDHMKAHDPKLFTYLDDETIAAFKERMGRANGSNPFKSLARSIVYQQIHGKAAASIYARFLELFEAPTDAASDWFPSPAEVLAKSDEELRSAGLSGRKVSYIQNLAQHFVNKSITPELFDTMSDEEISTQLCAVKGIGQWTVDMFLMLDLHHADVLPLGDLAVRKGVVKHFGLSSPSDKKKIYPLPDHMTQLTDVWRPYRSLGSWLMWRIQSTVVVGDSEI